MDEVLQKMRAVLAKRSGKATRKLAPKLGGWVDGDHIVVGEVHVELAWDVSTDSPHAVHKGTPDERRRIEVTRARRASGRVHIHRSHVNLQDAESRARSEVFQIASGLELPRAYVIEAAPVATFAEALDAKSARALLHFVVSKVAVVHGSVRVTAAEWPGDQLPRRRVRSLDDVQALIDLANALAEA